jgi:uncharacterized protein (DUF433 family)
MAERVIVSDADIMSGRPCFRGTRVPFKNLIDYLEGGHSLGEFLRQFPTVIVLWNRILPALLAEIRVGHSAA